MTACFPNVHTNHKLPPFSINALKWAQLLIARQHWRLHARNGLNVDLSTAVHPKRLDCMFGFLPPRQHLE